MLDVLGDNLGDYASGTWVTLRLVLASFVVALVLGTSIAALRAQPNPWLKRAATLYTEVFRGTPLLVLLFIFFAGVRRGGVDVGPWTAGIAALGVYTSAYVAEVLRSGLAAVSKEQYEAGLSLGFSERDVMRRIVLPQAVRTVIAPIGSVTIAMIRNSAIVGASLLALPDILKEARVVNSQTFDTEAAFLWGAVCYLILTVTVTIVFRRLETAYAVRR